MPFTQMLNLSFQKGIVPNELKLEKFILFNEDADPRLFTHYGLIAVLTCNRKVLEILALSTFSPCEGFMHLFITVPGRFFYNKGLLNCQVKI